MGQVSVMCCVQLSLFYEHTGDHMMKTAQSMIPVIFVLTLRMFMPLIMSPVKELTASL